MKFAYFDFQRKDEGWTAVTDAGEQRSFTDEEFNQYRRAAILGSIQRNLATYRFRMGEEIKTLIEWSSQYNQKPELVYSRIFKLGWTISDALLTPVGSKRVSTLPPPVTPTKPKKGRPKGAKNKPKNVTKWTPLLQECEVIIDLEKYHKFMEHSYVFRQDEFGMYSAYHPSNLDVSVADNIVEVSDGLWGYNCYHVPPSPNKKEAACKIMSIIGFNFNDYTVHI